MHTLEKHVPVPPGVNLFTHQLHSTSLAFRHAFSSCVGGGCTACIARYDDDHTIKEAHWGGGPGSARDNVTRMLVLSILSY